MSFLLHASRRKNVCLVKAAPGLLLLLGVVRAEAKPPVLPAASATSVAAEPEERYARACSRLRQGRQFNWCIATLRELAKTAPTDARYQSALACALVSRAASLGSAAVRIPRLEEAKQAYPSLLAQWQAAQDGTDKPPDEKELAQVLESPGYAAMLQQVPENDRQRTRNALVSIFAAQNANPFYKGDLAPPPPLLRTPDDGQPFLLSKEDAAKQISVLGNEAVVCFQKALDNTPADQKADLCFQYACGLRLLLVYKKDLALSDDQLPAQQAQAVQLLETGLKAKPDDAVLLQSLGDCTAAVVYSRSVDADVAKGVTAYEKSLALKPRNDALWLHYAQILTEKPATADRAKALAALRRLCRVSPRNTVAFYYLATLLLTDASATSRDAPVVQEAVRALDAGNKAPLSPIEVYEDIMPATLSVAWKYHEVDYAGSFSLPYKWSEATRKLQALCLTAVKNDASQKDPSLRILRTTLGVALQINHSLSVDLRTWDGPNWLMDILAGDIARGYFTKVVAVMEATQDTEGSAAAKQEQQSIITFFRAHSNAYWKYSKIRYPH